MLIYLSINLSSKNKNFFRRNIFVHISFSLSSLSFSLSLTRFHDLSVYLPISLYLSSHFPRQQLDRYRASDTETAIPCPLRMDHAQCPSVRGIQPLDQDILSWLSTLGRERPDTTLYSSFTRRDVCHSDPSIKFCSRPTKLKI